MTIAIDKSNKSFTVKLIDSNNDDTIDIDHKVDISLSNILKERTSTKSNLVLETKIAIYSELHSHTKAPIFQQLMDRCLSEYAKIMNKQQ